MSASDGSGSGALRVQPEALFRGAQELDDIAGELQNALRRLQSDVDSVVGVSWSGKASSVYAQHWSEFLSNAQEIIEDAQTIGQLVSYSAETYVYHEGKAAHDLSAVYPTGDPR